MAENGNAFPINRYNPGMSLRDWFAGQVLAADGDTLSQWRDHSEMAKRAYSIADAMLAAKEALPCTVIAGESLLASLDPDTLNPEQFNAWFALNAAIAKAKGCEA